MHCTITKQLKIVEGSLNDYKALSRFHYRPTRLGTVAGVYKLIETHRRRAAIEPLVGVIVYCYPAGHCQMRNFATDGLFTGLKGTPALTLINKNVRTVSRVVIEPRYRRLGLAHKLVAETMPLLNCPYIEALAVMGRVNPFFEKAGMMTYLGKETPAAAKLKAALSLAGIEKADLVDIDSARLKLNICDGPRREFIERHIRKFLSNNRRARRGKKLSRVVLEMMIQKLSDRPAYYLWRNPDVKLKI